MKFAPSILLLLVIVACQRQPQLARQPAPQNKFSDATLRTIFTAQDERKTAIILPYLRHELPLYRQEAAMALASVQDKATIPALLALLQDQEAKVRQAAAYALGQIGAASAEETLIKYAASEKTASVHAEITEALGKCATQKGLDYLAGFRPANDAEKAGQAWGLYRTNAKNLNYAAAARKAVSYLETGNIQPVRLGAAHFLARTPKLDLTPLP